MNWPMISVRVSLLSSAAALLMSMQLALAEEGSSASERLCMAEAVYYEARDQGWRGMIAVGVVIQNRVKDSRYPADICGVVHQGRYWNGHPVRHKCQFSYYCDGKPERPAEQDAWTMARDVATLLTSTDVNVAGIEDATHYHAAGTQPSWAAALERRKQIGGHVFYARK